MARGRMIDKRIAKSKKLAALKHDRSRVLYFMILPHLDVEGKFTGDPEEIKEDCCPKLKYSVRKIAESVVELADEKLLILYEVDDRPFIKYMKFDDFQVGIRKDKEAPSRIPDSVRTRDVPTPSLYLNLKLKLRKEGKKKKEIYFDFEQRKFFNIKIEDKAGWKDAYPVVDIDQELRIAREWLLANPTRAKSNYRQFLNNWFKREQDKGGRPKFQKGKGGYSLTRKDAAKKDLDDWEKKE
jgi:hypothetical protein